MASRLMLNPGGGTISRLVATRCGSIVAKVLLRSLRTGMATGGVDFVAVVAVVREEVLDVRV